MRIRILREAGGIGDVVRTIPVAMGLKEKYPECLITYYTIPGVRELIEYSPYIAQLQIVSLQERRWPNQKLCEQTFPYLKSPIPFDLTVDLLCPAYSYELLCKGNVQKNRIDIWCETADVTPSSYCPDVHVSPKFYAFAEQFWEKNELNDKTTIGIQPFSTSRLRCWPKSKWKELTARLIDAKYKIVVFDKQIGRNLFIPGIKALEYSLGEMIALVSKLDGMIAPDSGFYHLAGSLGIRTLGLFGPTCGRIMGKHYPQTTFITAESAFPGCTPPCYFHPSKGYKDKCEKQECFVLQNISVDQVFKRITSMIMLKR